MDNRFGFKEGVICVLLVGVAVVVLLAMKQLDRQGDTLRSIDQKLTGQIRDLARIRTMLEGGVVTERASEPVDDQTDPFARIREARQAEDYALGDYLVDVFAVVPDRLTPLVSSDAYASAVQSYVLESLAQRDPDTLEWSPLIATGWEIEDNSQAWQAYVDEQLETGRTRQQILSDAEAPSAVVITFTIRRGVEFSDGEPLTADDVVFSFNWIMNPRVEALRARAYYEKIKRVEKLDEYKVAFHFREPYFTAFELAAGMAILPEHFYSDIQPETFNTAPGLLMGSGPYRLEDPRGWRPEPGQDIELIRNERYWGGVPAPFDKLVWKVIENDAARLTTFRNGDIDTFSAQPEQYQSLLKEPELLARTQYFEFFRINGGYRYVGWNQRRGGKPTVFADRRVRQAMTMLTDRQRIVKEVMLGYAKVVTGPFNPLSPQYDQSIDPWPFDPARAIALLKEAGFADRDGDGVIDTPDGKPFRFELMYVSSSALSERIVLFIKDTFARAGVVVVPSPQEWSVLLQRVKDDREYDAVLLGWSGVVEGDPYQIFHSDHVEPPGDNATWYVNPDLDELIERARSTIDEDQRMALWHQVHQVLHEDQPYTFLNTPKALVFYDGRFRNIQRVTTGLNSILEWYVPANERKWTH